MVRKRLKKICIIAICLLLIINSIISAVISGDVHHIEHCDIDNCSICTIIHMAINFINNLIILSKLIYAIGIIIPIVSLMKKIIRKRNKNTLVEFKIQMNE